MSTLVSYHHQNARFPNIGQKSRWKPPDRTISRVNPTLGTIGKTSIRESTRVTRQSIKKKYAPKNCLTWNTIPAPVLGNILSYLENQDQLQLACSVSQNWRKLGHHTPQLWGEYEFVCQNDQTKAFKRENLYLRRHAKYIKGLRLIRKVSRKSMG